MLTVYKTFWSFSSQLRCLARFTSSHSAAETLSAVDGTCYKLIINFGLGNNNLRKNFGCASVFDLVFSTVMACMHQSGTNITVGTLNEHMFAMVW